MNKFAQSKPSFPPHKVIRSKRLLIIWPSSPLPPHVYQRVELITALGEFLFACYIKKGPLRWMLLMSVLVLVEFDVCCERAFKFRMPKRRNRIEFHLPYRNSLFVHKWCDCNSKNGTWCKTNNFAYLDQLKLKASLDIGAKFSDLVTPTLSQFPWLISKF